MNELKPIVFVDDDIDDIEILTEAYKTLEYPNKLLIFHDSTEACDYLGEGGIAPFLVICDVFMPKMTGLELHDKLLSFPGFSAHYIPFVYTSGAPVPPPSLSRKILAGHSYFEKKSDFSELTTTLDNIIKHYIDVAIK